MGRRPIGKVAMTSTERARRFRAALTEKSAGEIAALKARIAELEAEIARLEKELYGAERSKGQPPSLA